MFSGHCPIRVSMEYLTNDCEYPVKMQHLECKSSSGTFMIVKTCMHQNKGLSDNCDIHEVPFMAEFGFREHDEVSCRMRVHFE